MVPRGSSASVPTVSPLTMVSSCSPLIQLGASTVTVTSPTKPAAAIQASNWARRG